MPPSRARAPAPPCRCRCSHRQRPAPALPPLPLPLPPPMMPPPPTTVRRMTAAHHVWTPEREQTLRAALRTAPCASRAGRRVLDDEWQFHIARALAAAEPPSSGWAPTGDAVKQHYQKRLPLTDAVKQHYQKRLPLTDDTRAGLPDRATGRSYPFLASESLRRAPGGSPATNPAPSKSPPLPPPSPLHAFSLVHMSFLQVSFFTARALSRPRLQWGDLRECAALRGR